MEAMHARCRTMAPIPLRHWLVWQSGISALLALALAILMANPAVARQAPESFADLAERLSPSVVNISTTQKVEGDDPGPFEFQFPPGSPFEKFFERQRRKRHVTSLGSGFIIDAKGLVVTNNHVIAEADEITVTLSDGTKLSAKVLGKDARTDLALLEVKPKTSLPAVGWGDSDVARVGDWVVAIGNPFGLGGSVTAGIISARGRDINAGPYDDFIQTDASINHGNSGGPLFNLDGRVIGINTWIISPSGGSVGIGFAIPASLARNVIEQLEEHGRTRRGWLGVRVQTVTDVIAESLGLKKARGALVAGLSEEGPAAKAGLKRGDIILSFDHKNVGEMRALPRIVAETQIGKAVQVELWREEERLTVEVTIGELELAGEQQLASTDPKAAPSSRKVETLGMTLSGITPDLRDKFELREDASGVVIIKVDAESAAAGKGIRVGDIIVEVGREEVNQPEQVQAKVGQVKQSQRKSILLLLERQGDFLFVAVRLDDS